MKILKIFGVVVGIHVFALILIFANPGCSSSTKAPPAPADTVIVPTEPEGTQIVVPTQVAAANDYPPLGSALAGGSGASPVSAAPISFDPGSTASVGVRFSPTRPGTAAAGTLETQPVPDVTPATTYLAVKGDSLWTIAKKNHLTVSELAAANNIKAGAPVRVGQKLLIPSRPVPGLSAPFEPVTPPATTYAPPVAKAAGDAVHHVVKSGETLGAIARKYQVKVGDIATANSITDPARIRPGMELVIPGWQTPAIKAARPAAATASPAAIAPVSLPRPDQDLDAGLKPSTSSPPVIQIEDPTAPKTP